MNRPPPDRDPPDDFDELYRRASDLDRSRPSESTRRAVLAHAAALAADRTRGRAGRGGGFWSAIARRPRWQPAIVGTLAVATLAGLVIAPRFLVLRAPPESAPATVASPEPGVAAAIPAAPRTDERPATSPPTEAAGAAVNPPPRQARLAASGAHPAAEVSGAPVNAATAESGGTAGSASLEEAAVSTKSVAEGRGQALGRVAGGATSGVPADAARNADAVYAGVPAVAPPPATALPAAPQAAAAARQASAAPTVLWRAAEAGDLAELEAQLAKGADIESRDALGRTPLMLATLHGQTRAVVLLLARGADPNGADARATTPLQAAVAADEREIIAALRRSGAR